MTMVPDEISFESSQTMTQPQFAQWVTRRPAGDLYHYELLNGRVVVTPPAGYPHGEIEATLVRLIGNYVVERALGKVFGSSQGFELPSGATVEPDVTFVSNATWEASTTEEGAFLTLVPDLVVEIASPSTGSRDRGEKKAIYESAGVQEYWIVDPRSREVRIFQLGEKRRYDNGASFTTDEEVVSTVLAELCISVDHLFTR